jgi:hypothetical protein
MTKIQMTKTTPPSFSLLKKDPHVPNPAPVESAKRYGFWIFFEGASQ